MKRISVLLLLPVMLLALALGTAAQDNPEPVAPAGSSAVTLTDAPPQAPPTQYRIQNEDVLRISVWGEPNLSGEHQVDPQGNINITLLGQIHAEGLTVDEFIQEMRKGLDTYLVDPKIQVTLVSFRKPKVHVLGEVNRPGLQEFKFGDKVMEAIAEAGSFRDTADLRNATLTRKGKVDSEPLNLHELFYEGIMTKNVELQDGDVIYIPEDLTNKYYVLGEVLRPGQFKLKDDMTVMDAISSASGPTPRGILKGTVVIRGGGDPTKPTERLKLDLGAFISKADTTQNIKLAPGDVVYVPETSKPDWSKVSQVVSTIFNTSYLFRMLGL